jgi:Flp pilus assembly protein TadG
MNVTTHTAATPGAAIKARSLRERIRAHFRTRSDEGQSLLEFALCAPILLIVVTGISTFGFTLNNYLVMTNAVNTSAQLLAIMRNSPTYTDPCGAAVTAFQNAAPILKTSGLKYSFVLNGVSYASNTTTCTAGVTNLVQGQSAQMTVTYPCNLAVYGANLLPGCTLKVQTTEMVQ